MRLPIIAAYFCARYPIIRSVPLDLFVLHSLCQFLAKLRRVYKQALVYSTSRCTDDCGVTPLLVAAINDHSSICRLLINSNCRIDVVGDIKLDGVQRQLTPLQGAILRGNYDVARLLIFAGASVTSEKYLFCPEATIPQHLLEEDGLGLVIIIVDIFFAFKLHIHLHFRILKFVVRTFIVFLLILSTGLHLSYA
jgi:hypothetical protein